MYKEMRTIILGVLLLMTINVSGQCCYCNTYEDFLEGQWEKLDTVYCNSHSKSRQLWWGGNDFTLTTGDAATDRILKRDAFVVITWCLRKLASAADIPKLSASVGRACCSLTG